MNAGFCWSVIVIVCLSKFSCGDYYIGAGINDITGPAADVNLMGYANPAQIVHGIHLRIYSRAFVFADADLKNRFVFVSVDCGMISQIVKTKVTMMLKEKFGNLYTERNVALSSTHSHSGPAGFHQYILFDVTSLGFVNESYVAMTNGIFQSIVKAHNSIRKGRIFINSGQLLNANINRSPTSYLANPAEERKLYQFDVDKDMVLLKLVELDGKTEIGMINWFAVHGTSMNNTNQYISGDNKGVASMLFERAKNKNSRPGEGKFVAAFAQSNLGDVSPNIAGPRCIDSGNPCEIYTSTCNGQNEKCIAFGPGKDMFESTWIIGERQYQTAFDLYDKANIEIQGPIEFIHQYKEMTNVTLFLKDGRIGKTCPPSMGYSFAAGTTDGPGAFDFTQGDVKGNPFWNMVRNFIETPSKELIKCQAPKPILLPTGEMSFPHAWQPHIVETQVLRIGQFVIAAVPGEFTTMSGRRLRNTIRNVFKEETHSDNFTVVIAGLSNTYSDYIATYEEYQKQRYEAASTIFGPYTLDAYLSQYSNLTRSMIRNEKVDGGPPPEFNDHVISFLPPVIFDFAGFNKKFGQVIQQPSTVVKRNSTVSAVFVGASPRNKPVLGSSFIYVDRFDDSTKAWNVAFTDADWETKFRWNRTSVAALLFGESESTAEWTVPANQEVGKYRIRYKGTSKSLFSHYTDFEGISQTFSVE